MCLATLKKTDGNPVCESCPVQARSFKLLLNHIDNAKESGTSVHWETPTKAYLGKLSLSALRCPKCPVTEKDASIMVAGVVSGFLETSPSSAPISMHSICNSQSVSLTEPHPKLPEKTIEETQQPNTHLAQSLREQIEFHIGERALQSIAPAFRRALQKRYPVSEKTREIIDAAYAERQRSKRKLPAVDKRQGVSDRRINQREDPEQLRQRLRQRQSQ